METFFTSVLTKKLKQVRKKTDLDRFLGSADIIVFEYWEYWQFTIVTYWGEGCLIDPKPFSELIWKRHEKNTCLPWKLMKNDQFIWTSEMLKRFLPQFSIQRIKNIRTLSSSSSKKEIFLISDSSERPRYWIENEIKVQGCQWLFLINQWPVGNGWGLHTQQIIFS